MVLQNVKYVGDLRCEAQHAPSGKTLITDAPLDNMGKGESFSPTDLLATALSTCVLTTMAIAAKKLGAELGHSTASIEKHMTKEAPRRVAKLVCNITASGIEDLALRQKIEKAGYNCPVHLSLHPDVEQAISIVWRQE